MSSPPVAEADAAVVPNPLSSADAADAVLLLGGGLSTHAPLRTVMKFDTHSVHWVEFVHDLQFEGHGAQLPAAESPNWPSGQKVLQLPTATWYALKGVEELARHVMQRLASAGAVHVLQVGWQGWHVIVELSLEKPTGHVDTHWPLCM